MVTLVVDGMGIPISLHRKVEVEKLLDNLGIENIMCSKIKPVLGEKMLMGSLSVMLWCQWKKRSFWAAISLFPCTFLIHLIIS